MNACLTSTQGSRNFSAAVTPVVHQIYFPKSLTNILNFSHELVLQSFELHVEVMAEHINFVIEFFHSMSCL